MRGLPCCHPSHLSSFLLLVVLHAGMSANDRLEVAKGLRGSLTTLTIRTELCSTPALHPVLVGGP